MPNSIPLILPPELIIDILKLSFSDFPRHPSSLLLVNSEFSYLSLSVLHSNLRFTSVQQLELFVCGVNRLIVPPKSFSLTLPGGAVDFNTFRLLHDALDHILEILTSEREASLPQKLSLRCITFCLNSHHSDPNLAYLLRALKLVDPEEFAWIGPDPDHHFSTAIVRRTALYLFQAISSWTNLRHLKLTNIQFPSLDANMPWSLSYALDRIYYLDKYSMDVIDNSSSATNDIINHLSTPSNSYLSRLQTIYLGLVTFLDPLEIATIACSPGMTSLRSIRVVDAYQGSIWGPRVRIMDVEKALTAHFLESHKTPSTAGEYEGLDRTKWKSIPHLEDQIWRLRQIVRCEARTERIMGGDRMDS